MLNNGVVRVFAALLTVSAVVSAGPVGTYVCAVDNCVKTYSDRAMNLLEGCKAGVSIAVKEGGSEDDCLATCYRKYRKKSDAVQAACGQGCTLFPSACLRDGKIAPELPTRR